MAKTFNIPSFLKYLNIDASDNNQIQVIHYDEHPNLLLESDPVQLDFYLMALKDNIDVAPPIEEMSSAYMFLDKPGNILEWQLDKPFSGYAIFINSKLLDKFAKDYSFSGYTRHEALYLTERENKILFDLFIKAFDEFKSENASNDVLISYATLILSYTKNFYERQFQDRSKVYNKVVADFYKQLDQYYNDDNHKEVLPTVAHFADKANLSTNYFGDVIKHYTGQSPLELIHENIIQVAKKMLLNTKDSVNEIAYSLGFEYPNYFSRFFTKKTGLSPKVFRNQ
ncbi:helix-turn-helix domain-containing protein [Empedobacter sedimenti]|uniref:helix-turn-helix domain-containing protein n=1 Tax=Empedobacter sedimenti TaxID=3042610 RepID=UPI0024A6E312|nr:helix-turn-helix domain-containing protein [Empedobacter sedimenti]